MTEFSEIYGQELQFFSEIITDSTSVISSIEGGIGDVGSLLSGIGALSAAAGFAPGFTPTVAELVSGIQTEDTDLTNQISSINSLAGTTTVHENLVTGILSDFQTAITNSVNDLPQNYTSSSEITYLEDVLSSEANMSTYLTTLSTDIPNDNAAGLVSDNAYIYDFAQYTYTFLQDAVGSIDAQAVLGSL